MNLSTIFDPSFIFNIHPWNLTWFTWKEVPGKSEIPNLETHHFQVNQPLNFGGCKCFKAHLSLKKNLCFRPFTIYRVFLLGSATWAEAGKTETPPAASIFERIPKRKVQAPPPPPVVVNCCGLAMKQFWRSFSCRCKKRMVVMIIGIFEDGVYVYIYIYTSVRTFSYLYLDYYMSIVQINIMLDIHFSNFELLFYVLGWQTSPLVAGFFFRPIPRRAWNCFRSWPVLKMCQGCSVRRKQLSNEKKHVVG